MNAWFDSLGISMVQSIADGNADFTRQMGMLVKKEPYVLDTEVNVIAW